MDFVLIWELSEIFVVLSFGILPLLSTGSTQHKDWHFKIAEQYQILYASNLRPFHGLIGFHYSQAGCEEKGFNFLTDALKTLLCVNTGKEVLEMVDNALSLAKVFLLGVNGCSRQKYFVHTLG